MAEKRIDGRDARFHECEEHDVEFGDIGQLHQCRVAFAYAGCRKPGGQVGRQTVEFGIGETPLAAEDSGRIGPHGGLFFQCAGEGFVDPVALFAIEAFACRWPMGKFDGHDLFCLK